jgi:hypothetical protein
MRLCNNVSVIRRRRGMRTLMSPGLGIILLLTACALPAPKPTVKITQPAEGAMVEQTQMVRGTSRAVPDGQVVWVVIFVQKVGRYYPQNQAADVQANGEWASLTYIGIPSDVGLKFDLIAVLADKEGQASLDKYLVNAKNKSDYSGLGQLPNGVTVYDRISVTRK